MLGGCGGEKAPDVGDGLLVGLGKLLEFLQKVLVSCADFQTQVAPNLDVPSGS